MSEKLYAFFLRLYPAHFRQEYGEEALQLFRDRARDEQGFFSRLRLWFDLFFDVTISLPREYLHLPSPGVTVPAPRPLHGFPAFYVFQNESPRPGAFLAGGVLSLVALTTCWVSLNQVHRPDGSAATAAGSRSAGNSRRSESPSSARRASSETGRANAASGVLVPAERKRILAYAISNLKEHYIDRAAGQRMAEAIAAHEKRGDYDSVTDAAAFAAILTQHMREIVPDRHLTFEYFQDPIPPQTLAQTAESLADDRQTLRAQNCTFEKVELLPRNIGYLKLNSFPDPEACRVAAMAAMTYIDHADAVIVDLRDNRGGNPAMVQFLGAYLFDHPEYWYNPREATTENSWTQSPVAGSHLADKPVFLLTSSRTSSGAEQFCYDLKMLKRATIIGETTAGAAHSGIFHRLDDHYGMGIPEVKAINPYSANDWAEVGVEPDIKASSDNALEIALKLAKSRPPKK